MVGNSSRGTLIVARDESSQIRLYEVPAKRSSLAQPLLTGESELVIMIAVVRPKRCMGRTECPDLRGLRGEPWLDQHLFN